MPRRPIVLAACALALSAAVTPTAARAHEGSPDMESLVRRIVPAAPGVSVEILNRDDRMVLTNRGTSDVTILGYDKEPYARVSADGTVEINQRSSSTYLNEDRYSEGIELPAIVSDSAPPQWKVLDRTGRFEWHDHRMHYMSKARPPQVKDPDVRTKVYDYTVPLKVGAQTAAIEGTLWWTPRSGGGPPAAAIGGLVVLALAGLGAVVLVRRRRAAAGDGDGDGGADGGSPGRSPAAEAW